MSHMMIYLFLMSLTAIIGIASIAAMLFRRYRNLERDNTAKREECCCLREKIESLEEELKGCRPSDILNDYDYHTQYLAPVLTEMGCSPKVDSDEGLVLFRYQGWTYYFKGPSGSLFQRLVLPAVLNISQDDPNLPTFIESCNLAHREWGPKIVWDVTEDEETSEVSYIFNIVFDVVLPPVSEHRDRYIEAFLDSFVSSADVMRLCIRRLMGDTISELERNVYWKVNPKTVITKAHFN